MALDPRIFYSHPPEEILDWVEEGVGGMELSGEGPDVMKSRQDAHLLRYFMVPGCKNTSIVRFNNTFSCSFFFQFLDEE